MKINESGQVADLGGVAVPFLGSRASSISCLMSGISSNFPFRLFIVGYRMTGGSISVSRMKGMSRRIAY